MTIKRRKSLNTYSNIRIPQHHLVWCQNLKSQLFFGAEETKFFKILHVFLGRNTRKINVELCEISSFILKNMPLV